MVLIKLTSQSRLINAAYVFRSSGEKEELIDNFPATEKLSAGIVAVN